MQEELTALWSKPAAQQPDWPDRALLRRVREQLTLRPPLVRATDVHTLGSLLARVALGECHVVQSGDCAEDPAECGPDAVAGKVALLHVLAGVLRSRTTKPVLRVGRIAGQFAKPRSRTSEVVDGVELPVYRGHMVNGPEPDPVLRRPDPARLLAGYDAASAVIRCLRRGQRPKHAVWTSHEALLLDYEIPMLRREWSGRWLLTSTHWPWIGDRTNHADGAHAALLSTIANPVAAKVGPTMTPAGLVALCERLDPGRIPGRVTLIARMGADAVADGLPPLVAAVRSSGHSVVWLTDPLHGNTINAPSGVKTRCVDTIIREVEAFQDAVTVAGGVPGGLHLETTPDDVVECIATESAVDLPGAYTSLCDPRLNPRQAVSVVSAWATARTLRSHPAPLGR